MIQLLLANKTLIAIGILVLAMAGMGIYIKSLKGDIRTLEAEKSELTTKLEISNASIKTLQSAIAEQNAAVEKFKNEAAEREKRNAEALNRARISADANRKRANDLLTRKPPVGVSDCKAADDLINEAVRNAKQK